MERLEAFEKMLKDIVEKCEFEKEKMDELKAQGFITISGRVNKQYFLERVCYGTADKRKDVI